MKKGIYLILVSLALMAQGCIKEFIKHHHDHYEGCGHDQDPDPPVDQETTIKFSRNQMIVRFDDSYEGDKNALRGTDPDSEFVLEADPEPCNCGDSGIELWTIDTTATGTNIESARDRLNRGDSGGEVKGDINFEITIAVDVPIEQQGGTFFPTGESIDGDVVIAVLDTGINYEYERADYDYLLNTERIVCDGSDNGWNFVENVDYPADDHGHGTYVTKIIRNLLEPTIGFKVIPLRVFDTSGKGSYSNILCAMNYLKQYEAHENGKNIDIVNASFGGTMPVAKFESLTLLPDLIEELGDDTVVIASAGNEETEVDDGDIRHFPSGFDSDNILAVGGYSAESGSIQIHPMSNRGNSSIDLAAYYGPYNLEFISFSPPDVAVNDLLGTSYSAAYVTGIAAKAKGENMGIEDLRGHVLDVLAVPNDNLLDFIAGGKVIELPPTP